MNVTVLDSPRVDSEHETWTEDGFGHGFTPWAGPNGRKGILDNRDGAYDSFFAKTQGPFPPCYSLEEAFKVAGIRHGEQYLLYQSRKCHEEFRE